VVTSEEKACDIGGKGFRRSFELQTSITTDRGQVSLKLDFVSLLRIWIMILHDVSMSSAFQ